MILPLVLLRHTLDREPYSRALLCNSYREDGKVKRHLALWQVIARALDPLTVGESAKRDQPRNLSFFLSFRGAPYLFEGLDRLCDVPVVFRQ